jgi:hypothetical protein
MEVNKMNGKKFVNGASTALLAGALAVTGCASPKRNDEADIKSQMEHDQKIIEYYDYLENEDIELYDTDFVNFFRDGKIVIDDKEYKTGDIYLETGLINGNETLFLVYYRFPQVDLLNHKEKVNFKRTGLMEFRVSYVFYQMYLDNKGKIVDNKLIINNENIKSIDELVRSYDGTTHVETPETAYKKVKPRSQK